MKFGRFPMVPGVDPTQLDVQNPNLHSDSPKNREKSQKHGKANKLKVLNNMFDLLVFLIGL